MSRLHFPFLCLLAFFSASAQAEFRGLEIIKPITEPQTDAQPFPTDIVPNVTHNRSVQAMSFSPDGQLLATGSYDSSVRLWDVATGRLLRKLSGHPEQITALAFSPNGKQLISGDLDAKSFLWEVETGRRLITFTRPDGWGISRAFALSSDSRFAISLENSGDIVIWDLNSKTIVQTIGRDQFKGVGVFGLALSPDNKSLFAAYNDKAVRLWDVTSGKLIHTFSTNTKPRKIAVSPDGMLLAIADDSYFLSLWDVQSGKIKRSMEHGRPIESLAFAPDGRSVFIVTDMGRADPPGAPRGILIWDVESGAQNSVIGSVKSISSAAFSPSGELVALGSNDGSVQVQSSSSGKSLWAASSVKASLTLSPDPRREVALLTSEYGWDLQSGRRIEGFPTSQETKDVTAFSPDGGIVAAAGPTRPLAVYEASSKRLLREFDFPVEAGLRTARFSADGTLLGVILNFPDGPSAVIVSVKSGTVLSRESAGQHDSYLELSPDGKTYAIGNLIADGPYVNIFGVNGKHQRSIRTGAEGNRSAPVFSADGNALFVGADQYIKKFDPRTGKPLLTLRGHTGAVTSLQMRPDGKVLLSGSNDGTMKLWDPATGRLLSSFPTGTAIDEVAFSAQGKLLALNQDGVVAVREPERGALLANLYSLPGKEWIALTPEGFFDASEKGGEFLSAVRGTRIYTIEQFFQKLYAPFLLQQKLAGDPRGKVRDAAASLDLSKAAASGPPPRVSIVNPKAGLTVTGNYVEVEIEINAQGGGVGNIDWRVNDQLFGRETIAAGASSAPVRLKKMLPIKTGDNQIAVGAYNSAGVIESQRATTIVKGVAKDVIAKARLFVLAIGVNNYATVRPKLSFARQDAESVVQTLRRGAGTLYEVAPVAPIVDADVTASNIERRIGELSRAVQPEDVFILYLAGHGKTVDQQFFFLPYDFRNVDAKSIVVDGIGQDKLISWLASIPARRSLLLIDSCESGSAIQERADAVTLMSKSANRTIITATTEDRPAAEGVEGHGVFTFTILSGFDAADQDKDGKIDILELMKYVGDTLPKIADKQWGIEQKPLFSFKGENFPLAQR
ncbi:caspase family protein [Bradyrhizobium diazoefficiens]|nr:caspase family protein [Bradyrhizobium diazoefficiens]MBR0773238.1 caspase family protein [Bradyrhizobium diazoefficiens]